MRSIQDAKHSFESFLNRRQVHIQECEPLSALDALIDWYASERLTLTGGRLHGYDLSGEQDIVRINWGITPDGRHLYLNLWREFVVPEWEDSVTWQLRISYRFSAAAGTMVQSGTLSFARYSDAAEFKTSVAENETINSLQGKQPTSVVLELDQAGRASF